MATVTVSLAEAHSRVLSAGGTDEALNPVYRQLLRHVAPADTGNRRAAEEPGRAGVPHFGTAAGDALLTRHLSAQAMLVLAVEGDGPLRRLRIGIHADGASIESSAESDGVSRWEDVPRTELLERIRGTLPQDGTLSAPPRLTIEQRQGADRTDSRSERVGQVLRLSPEQMAEAERRLRAGTDPRAVFADLEGVDSLLRDALTATGVRASLSAVLQDPRGTQQSSSLVRLWSVGELGVYRTDVRDSAVLEVVPVAPGDLLATAIGLLEESFRFAAEASVGGRA